MHGNGHRLDSGDKNQCHMMDMKHFPTIYWEFTFIHEILGNYIKSLKTHKNRGVCFASLVDLEHSLHLCQKFNGHFRVIIDF